MAKQIRPKPRTLIPSSFLVRALAFQGRRYHCRNCGELMFVRYESGLCPLCYNEQKPWRLPEDVTEVPPELALVGVLDDPAVDPGPTS